MAKSDVVIKTAVGHVYYAHLQQPRPEGTIKKKVGNRTVETPIPARYECMFVPTEKATLKDMVDSGISARVVDVDDSNVLAPINGKSYINARRSVLDRQGQARKALPLYDANGKVVRDIKVKGNPVKIGNGSKVKIQYIESAGGQGVGCFLVGVQILDLVPYESAPAMAKESGSFVADDEPEDSITESLSSSDNFPNGDLPWEV